MTHALEMTSGFRFSPSSLTIAVGDSVRVHNAATEAHTFTGSTFDSGNMNSGAVKTFRFPKAGTFDFVCSYHQTSGMTGTLTVR